MGKSVLRPVLDSSLKSYPTYVLKVYTLLGRLSCAAYLFHIKPSLSVEYLVPKRFFHPSLFKRDSKRCRFCESSSLHRARYFGGPQCGNWTALHLLPVTSGEDWRIEATRYNISANLLLVLITALQASLSKFTGVGHQTLD